MIDGVTKLDRIKFGSQEEAQAATIRKMVVAMAQDVRVLLIKLADRLHNLRTISALRPEKQQRIAKETLEVYAPLAHRLGMEEVKHEMEDRCFAVLQPLRYEEIQEQLAARTPERDAYLEKVMTEVRGALQDAAVDASVTGRPKHPYPIYRKMVAIGQAFSEIHDIIGIRITTEEMRDCYAALGVIHAMWPPVQGRFKDYIAMPKFNLYQSLHTTVIGPDGRPLEVQIRTREMNRRAESGIAAHWRYKEGEERLTSSGWQTCASSTRSTATPTSFSPVSNSISTRMRCSSSRRRATSELSRVGPPRSTSPTPSTPRWETVVWVLGSTGGWSRLGPGSSRATSSRSSPRSHPMQARAATGPGLSVPLGLGPRSSSGSPRRGARSRSPRVVIRSRWLSARRGSG